MALEDVPHYFPDLPVTSGTTSLVASQTTSGPYSGGQIDSGMHAGVQLVPPANTYEMQVWTPPTAAVPVDELAAPVIIALLLVALALLALRRIVAVWCALALRLTPL